MLQSLRAEVIDATINNNDAKVIELGKLIEQIIKLKKQGLNVLGWNEFILMARQNEIDPDKEGSFLLALKFQTTITENRMFLNELNYLISSLDLNDFESLTISKVVKIYRKYKPDEISTQIKEKINIDIRSSIEELNFPQKILNFLHKNNINYIHHLTKLSPTDLINLGLNEKHIKIIRSTLKEFGIDLQRDPNINETNIEFLLEEKGIINKSILNFLKNTIKIEDLWDLRKRKFSDIKNTFSKMRSGNSNFVELLKTMKKYKIYFIDKDLKDIQEIISNTEM